MLSDSMRLPLPSVEMVACMTAKSPVQNAESESYSPKYEVPGGKSRGCFATSVAGGVDHTIRTAGVRGASKRITKTRQQENTKQNRTTDPEAIRSNPILCCFFRVFVLSRFRDSL